MYSGALAVLNVCIFLLPTSHHINVMLIFFGSRFILLTNESKRLGSKLLIETVSLCLYFFALFSIFFFIYCHAAAVSLVDVVVTFCMLRNCSLVFSIIL